jgi:hypothetical protein
MRRSIRIPRPSAILILTAACLALILAPVRASNVVPDVIKQPGSQPLEAAPSTSRCENCHGGYDTAVEPGFNWRGSMMSHSTRDPIFWATVIVAEQDFIPNLTVWNNLNPSAPPGTDPPGGVGDFCIRCHTPEGWMAGRSTPTDGTGLSVNADFDGVSCDSCHRMMDPGTAEGRLRMAPGQEAYWIDPSGQFEGFYGSGMYLLDPGGDKRGPFDDANSLSHGPIPSLFHRSGDFCGSCHDVSNPAVGHFAPNHGRLDTLPLPVGFCGVTKTACASDAACADCFASQSACETTCGGTWIAASSSCDRRDTCRTKVGEAYPPYMYGVVERTYSEWKASGWPTLPTAGFLANPAVPADLKVAGGAPEVASRNAPYNSSTDPIYNPVRTFSCQSCHMHSVTGQGCNKNPETRTDLPLHDQTGGNTWMPFAMASMSAAGTLRGGALPSGATAQLDAGVLRARAQLRMSVKVDALTRPPGGLDVRVTNLTGHKFLSGYPEGRRAWVNVRWYDATDALIHEDGRYEPADGELHEEGTRVYSAHPGMSRDWAEVLLAVGYDPALALGYDLDGNVTSTLGQLASGALGDAVPTFHFVLNNRMLEDNRIPPFGFDPVEAARRNARPVPADAYPVLGTGKLQHWDEVSFPVPVGAARAEVQMYYQSTSREYINFLRRANHTNTEGEDLYQAWLATGMAPPEPLIASGGSPVPVAWSVPACAGPPAPVGETLLLTTPAASAATRLTWGSVPDATGYRVHRWSRPDRSGEDASHHQVPTWRDDAENPPLDGAFFYEIGSTSACGETIGEF